MSGGFTPNQYVKAYGIHALQFARCFGLPTPTMRVFSVGTSRALPPGDETTLDLEVLTGVAPRARLDVYDGGATLADLALTYAAPLDAPARRRPQVISASLGVCELGLTSDPVAVEVLEYLFAAAAAGGIAWSPPLVTMAPRGAPRTASTAATPTIRLPHPE